EAVTATLWRANLLVAPHDDTRRWYCYHHLFADVLKARSREEQPDRALALHWHASEWFARNGQPTEAIHHALAAGDFERVASLIELVARATVRKSNQSARLLEWLKLVPDDLIRARPVLSTYYAFAQLAMGRTAPRPLRWNKPERCPDEPLAEPPSGVDASVARRDRAEAPPLTL